MKRSLAVCLVLLVVLTITLWWRNQGDPSVAAGAERPGQVFVENVQDVDQWLKPLDQPVRVLLVEGAKASAPPDGDPPLLGGTDLAVQHLGHLAAEDLASLTREMDEYASIKRRQLEEFSKTVAVGDTSKLAEEAGMLAINEIAIAACDAVKRGSYLTLEPPKTLLELPQCEVMSTRALMAGKQVNLVVVMPYSQYPTIKAARAYQLAAREAAAQEFAYAFNSRSDAERAAMFARYQTIEDKRKRGQELTLEEIRFLHVDFGVGLLVEQDVAHHLFRFSPPDPRDR